MINISWGGCRIEAMSARESFAGIPGLEETAATVEKQIADMNSKQDSELRKDKQRLPTVLYNAMVHPLTPFAVKGMLWYQGEDNHYEGAVYGDKLKALARTWRNAFANPTLPIYIVQLPPFNYHKTEVTRLPNFWPRSSASPRETATPVSSPRPTAEWRTTSIRATRFRSPAALQISCSI